MSRPSVTKSETHTRTLVVWLAALCLIAIPLLVIPVLFRLDSLSEAVLRQVEERIGHPIDVAFMRVTVFPRLGVELTDVRVRDATTTDRLFSARRMELVLQVLPLFRGRLIGQRLTIERPHLELQRDEAGHWTFASHAGRSSSSQAQPENPLAFVALVRNVLLTNGQITLTDRSDPSRRHVQVATGLQVILTEGLPGRTALLQVQGEIPGESSTALFSLNGTLIQPRSDAPDQRSPASPIPLQFDGTVRMDGLDLRQLVAWSGWEVLDEAQGSVGLDGRIRLIPRSAGYDLIVPEWTADFGDVSLRGHARLTGWGAGTPSFSATLSSSPLHLRRWLEHVPARWKPATMMTMLTEREVDGVVAVRTATVSGSVTAGSPAEIAAEIQINEGRFLPAPHHSAIERASATMFYDRNGIRLVDLQADYGPIRLARGEILVSDVGADPAVDARVSGTAQAAGMIGLVQTLDSPYIEPFLTGFEQAQGDIAVAAHFAGRPVSGSLDLVDADVTIHEVGLQKPTLPVPIQKMNGRLRFSSGTIRIDTLSGRVGPAQVDAQGSVAVAGGTPNYDLRIEVSAEARDLASVLPAETMGGRADLAGPIRLSATVSGPLQTPQITGAMDLQETALGIPNIVTKPMGAPASIEFAGKISADRVLLVRRVALLVPPIRLAGEGHVRLSDRWDFAARVVAKPVALEKLPKGISVGAVKRGVLEAALDVNGRVPDRASWQTTGRLRLQHGVIAPDGLRTPVRNAAFIVRFEGRDVAIEHAALTIGGSDLRVRGSIASWLNAPQAALVIESSQFDLGLLQGAGRSEPSQEDHALSAWLVDARIAATVLVKAAYYDRFLFTNVSCRVSLDHGLLTVDRISGDTDEGHLGGRLVVQPPERGTGHIKSAFRIVGIPIQRVLSLVTKEAVLKGWLSANGKGQAELGRDGLILSSMTSTRPIRLIIEDGRIFKVPVISKLLSVMNLPAILQGEVNLTKDGLPFDQLRGVFSVANGIVAFTEIALTGPILKISGSGRYDFMADQLEMVLATSPLGSYSDLLKRIPLFGKIFAGEREGLDTAVFEVKGAAADPDITYLPAESLTRGVKGMAQFALDVLVNTLTLPKTVVEDFLGEEDDRD